MLLEWKGTGLGKQTQGTRGALHTEGQDPRNVITSTFYTKGFSKGDGGDRDGWEEGKVGGKREDREGDSQRMDTSYEPSSELCFHMVTVIS